MGRRRGPMVYQIDAGYAVAGLEIKVPQVFIPRLLRSTIIAQTATGSQQLNQLHTFAPVSPVTLADCVTVNAAIQGWVLAQYHNLYSDSIRVVAIHTRSMEALVVPQDTVSLSQA